MDSTRFDALARSLAGSTSRRRALRLLASGLLAGLLTPRLHAAALQADRDGDGLFDDDETGIYGTNPDLADTDGDGSSDGEEVYFGTDPLTAGGTVARADSDGDGLFDDDETAIYGTNPQVVDSDGDGVGDGEEVFAGTDPLGGGAPPADPAPPATCRGNGVGCNLDSECCQGALCCFDGVSLTTRCADVTTNGGVCPGDLPPRTEPCPAGLTECAGECFDLLAHAAHCGACGNSCGLGGVCTGGVCGAPTGNQTCDPAGTPCTSPYSCCSGSCDFLVGGGTCSACGGHYCDAANLCCPGTECINNRCEGCLDRGIVCIPGSMSCCFSECTNGVCLSGAGGRCVHDADCAACYSRGNCANACLNGVCQV